MLSEGCNWWSHILTCLCNVINRHWSNIFTQWFRQGHWSVFCGSIYRFNKNGGGGVIEKKEYGYKWSRQNILLKHFYCSSSLWWNYILLNVKMSLTCCCSLTVINTKMSLTCSCSLTVINTKAMFYCCFTPTQQFSSYIMARTS